MKVVAVVPSFRSKTTIAMVVTDCLKHCSNVVVVDDSCPDQTGNTVDGIDPRVIVVYREENGGVGAATKTGILRALSLDADIIVKIDSDGQMNPDLIPLLIQPIRAGEADFCKGTRFDSPEDLEGMPLMRLVGNAALSLINKFSSGYWSVNDPTNGFLALSANLSKELRWDKIADDYFFESDLLFRLRLVGARISQMRMKSVYGSERSGLKPIKILIPFLANHLRNQFKRLIYMYFVREWNLGTIYLLASLLPLGVAIASSFSAFQQAELGSVGTGTAVLSSLGFILWVQLTTQFIAVDVTSEPRHIKM